MCRYTFTHLTLRVTIYSQGVPEKVPEEDDSSGSGSEETDSDEDDEEYGPSDEDDEERAERLADLAVRRRKAQFTKESEERERKAIQAIRVAAEMRRRADEAAVSGRAATDRP